MAEASRRRRDRRLAGAASVLLLAAAACRPTPPEAARRGAPRTPNVLLVTIDTLRADHLGCYGYGVATSPSLDALAARAALFERAYSSSSWTLPSLASLMTGQYAQTHGCNFNGSPLSASFDTLAERLADAGYETAAIVNHFYLADRYGLDQGFAEYDDELAALGPKQSARAVTSAQVTERGIAWLEPRLARADGRPWFLWVHYFDPHWQYQPHAELAGTFSQQPAGEGQLGDVQALIELYDGEIAFTDRQIGRLLDSLEGGGGLQDSVVVVTADHGEEFKDHGGLFHRKTLYEEIVRVPLLIHVPGSPARRVPDVVGTVDLLPTLLELCGLPAPQPGAGAVAGRSLAPLLHGGALAGEARLTQVLNKVRDVAALVDGRWKLVCDRLGGQAELYDLQADPGETTDLAATRAEVVAELRAKMEALIGRAEQAARRHERSRRIELGAEDRRLLDELGYGGDD